MYRQCMNVSEMREKAETRREKGQAWEPTRVLHTHAQARVSPAPLNSPSPQERPAKWTHKKIQKQTKKSQQRIISL